MQESEIKGLQSKNDDLVRQIKALSEQAIKAVKVGEPNLLHLKQEITKLNLQLLQKDTENTDLLQRNSDLFN